jgi:hypothetical protein
MESYDLGVPPPLKRGLPANTPSKVYAAGNKRKVKPSKAKTPRSSTAKPKKPCARRLRLEDSEGSEGSPIFYGDEYEDSDGEYGSTKKKRRISGVKGNGKKERAVAPKTEDDGKNDQGPQTEIPTTQEDDTDKGTAMADADIHESIETQSSFPKTRGVKHNYAKMDTDSDGNEDEDNDAPAEELQEEEDAKEENKSVGEISPRTNSKTVVADPSGFVSVALACFMVRLTLRRTRQATQQRGILTLLSNWTLNLHTASIYPLVNNKLTRNIRCLFRWAWDFLNRQARHFQPAVRARWPL